MARVPLQGLAQHVERRIGVAQRSREGAGEVVAHDPVVGIDQQGAAHPVLGPLGLAQGRQALDPGLHGRAVAAILGDRLLGPFQGDPGDPPSFLRIAQGGVATDEHKGRFVVGLDERGLFVVAGGILQAAQAVVDGRGAHVHLVGLGIEPQSDGDLSLRLRVPARLRQSHRLQRPGLGQIGVEGQSPVQGGLAAIAGPPMHAVKGVLRRCHQSPGLGVTGIEVHGPAGEALDRLQVPRIAVVAGQSVRARHQIEVVGIDIVRAALLDRRLLLRQQFQLQRFDDGLADLVLQGEDVVELAVVALGPQMAAGGPVNQLSGDPHPAAGFAHAAFQDVADAQLPGQLAHIEGLALELEGGVAGDDEQGRDLGEVGDDVLADPVAEILLLGIAAHVGERQNADGELADGRLGHARSWRLAAHQFCDAGDHLLPVVGGEITAPAGQIRTLDTVERPGELGAVDRQLDELVIGASGVRLRLHPLRSDRLGRPDDDHGLGRLQPFLDHLGIGPVGGQFVIAPDVVAQPTQSLGDRLGLRRRRAGVGDEDVGHSHATPPLAAVLTLSTAIGERQGKGRSLTRGRIGG